MERYTILQRVRIVKTFYLNNESMIATIRNLRQEFGRNSNLVLRSPDLCEFLKEKVYTNRSNTVEQLKNNIREVIQNIPPETHQKVMENAIKRTQVCAASRGGHFSDIIFHT